MTAKALSILADGVAQGAIDLIDINNNYINIEYASQLLNWPDTPIYNIYIEKAYNIIINNL